MSRRALLILTLAAGAAVADEQTPPDRVIPGWERGPYAFFGLGAYELHTHAICPRVDGGCAGDESVNYTSGQHMEVQIGFGFRFSRFVAVETMAALMPGGSDTSPNGPVPLESNTSMDAAWDIQPVRLRLDLPLRSGLSVYGTGGVGWKITSLNIGELNAQMPAGCQVYSDQYECVREATSNFQAVANIPNRFYLPVSVGLEWWLSPDWAINVNYQPPRGPDISFYRMTLSVVGAF